jgi:glycosyltransferase involved in cell wall biosynthesis
MKSTTPVVSIVVLTYNHQNTIKLTLDSLVQQKCNFPFEIIIGEDASADSTRKIVMNYAETYPGIFKVLEKAPNKGLLLNYQDACTSCSGKYIALCAGDDYWHNPEKLQKQVDFLEQNPDYGFVHSDVDIIIESEARTIKNFNSSNGIPNPSDDLYLEVIAEIRTIYAPTVMFRKDLLQYVDFNEFTAGGYKMEDLPMMLEFSAHTKAHYIPEALATYRIIDGSLCHPDTSEKKKAFLDSIYKVQLHYYHKYYEQKFDVNKIHYAHKARYMQMYEELNLFEAAYKLCKELATSPVKNNILVSVGQLNYYVFRSLIYIRDLRRKLKTSVT